MTEKVCDSRRCSWLHSASSQAAILLQGAPPGFPRPTNGPSPQGSREEVSEGPRPKSMQQGQTLQQGQVPERQTRGRPDSSVSHSAIASVNNCSLFSIVPCRVNHSCQQPIRKVSVPLHGAAPGEACSACTCGQAAARAAHSAWPAGLGAPSTTGTAAKPLFVAALVPCSYVSGLLHMHLSALSKLHASHHVAECEVRCTCLQPGSSVPHGRTNTKRRDAVADTQELRSADGSQARARSTTGSPRAAASQWEEDSGEAPGAMPGLAWLQPAFAGPPLGSLAAACICSITTQMLTNQNSCTLPAAWKAWALAHAQHSPADVPEHAWQ